MPDYVGLGGGCGGGFVSMLWSLDGIFVEFQRCMSNHVKPVGVHGSPQLI